MQAPCTRECFFSMMCVWRYALPACRHMHIVQGNVRGEISRSGGCDIAGSDSKSSGVSLSRKPMSRREWREHGALGGGIRNWHKPCEKWSPRLIAPLLGRAQETTWKSGCGGRIECAPIEIAASW